MRVVIIGSGISGLTAAACLAQSGHDVTVFEQFPRAGGVTAPFEREGYRWDLGQLIIQGLGPDEPTGEVLADLGVADRVRIVKDDRGYVFRDFELRKPEQYEGVLWRINLLKKLFPNERKGLDAYWKYHLRFTSVMTHARRMEKARGLEKLYHKAGLYLKLLPLLPKKSWNAQQMMDSFFTSRELQVVFLSLLADTFTPPSRFIGLGVSAVNPETAFDKRIPKRLARNTEEMYHYSILGGIGTLVDALIQKIEECGGRIRTSNPIEKILIKDNRATGVLGVDGEETSTDVVIASGGAKETFLKLVGEEHLPPPFLKKVREIPLMDSVFMVHLGVDFDPSLHVHGVCTYYYGAYDLEDAIAQAQAGLYHEGRDGFVVHVPTLHSPEMAPPGHHAMTIYTICPDRLKDGTWRDRKEEYADKLLAHAERYIPNLRQHVRVREILTPEDFRTRTHLDHHSFGGIAILMGTSGIPHKTPIENLWFVGQQSESAGGINNVIPAAYKTAKRIEGGS
jgi:prolycopene isomerase